MDGTDEEHGHDTNSKQVQVINHPERKKIDDEPMQCTGKKAMFK